jgi:hypothetical protein
MGEHLWILTGNINNVRGQIKIKGEDFSINPHFASSETGRRLDVNR